MITDKELEKARDWANAAGVNHSPGDRHGPAECAANAQAVAMISIAESLAALVPIMERIARCQYAGLEEDN